MISKDKFVAARADVVEAAVQPLLYSRKIYVEDSRADIRVPMRDIRQADTPTGMGVSRIRRSASMTPPAPTPTGGA